jgi:hypothetical protein
MRLGYVTHGLLPTCISLAIPMSSLRLDRPTTKMNLKLEEQCNYSLVPAGRIPKLIDLIA